MADKKFVNLHESYMRRYQRGGFLVGDVFKFNDNYKSDDSYKKLGKSTQGLITKLIDSGLNIRITDIKDTEPARFPGNPQTSSLDVVLNLALDQGGGRYSDHVSVPCCLGQSVEYYPNLLPIPDAMRRKSNVNIKPEEINTTDTPVSDVPPLGTDAADGPDEGRARDMALPKQNVEIPSDPATPSPAVTSYTNQYLADLK
jgi:hypothetical protein